MKKEGNDISIECIKEFIQTFGFAKNMEILIDQSSLKETNKKYKDNNSNIINLYSSYSIWLCMNEIYPPWFDISIHPAQFDTELEAYECLLKYINEYHESKYDNLIKKITSNLSKMTTDEFKDIYSIVILAALVSENKQKHINNILSVSHETQKCIHHIVELLDKEENYNGETGLLESDSYKDIKKENDSLKNEVKQIKEKVKFLEMENENISNSLTEKSKIINEYNEKVNTMQKKINTDNEKSKKQYITQIEDQEKKINELQNNLEKEIKDKSYLENDLKNKIKELEDEQNILKQENLNIDNLQNKIKKYKEKLESLITVQRINKELEERLKNNTQKMVDMESEIENLKLESNNLKKYKNKCDDLDTNLENAHNENYKLKQEISEKNKTLEKLKRDLDEKTISYDKLKKEKNFDQINIGLSNVDQTEKLIRVKKENENLKKQLELYTNEEQKKHKNEVELKTKNKNLSHKMSKNINDKSVDNDPSLNEKYQKSLKELEVKKNEIKELTEINQKIMVQMANIQGSPNSTLKEKIIKLEAELLMEKKNCAQVEETTENKLKKEFNSILQILKDQLQIREKETEYYKDALKSQINIVNDEQKLLGGIIHNLGLKYKQLQTYNICLRNEITGIKLRTEACAEYEKK